MLLTTGEQSDLNDAPQRGVSCSPRWGASVVGEFRRQRLGRPGLRIAGGAACPTGDIVYFSNDRRYAELTDRAMEYGHDDLGFEGEWAIYYGNGMYRGMGIDALMSGKYIDEIALKSFDQTARNAGRSDLEGTGVLDSQVGVLRFSQDVEALAQRGSR